MDETVRIDVNVPPGTREAMRREAQEQGVTLRAYLRMLLIRKFGKESTNEHSTDSSANSN